MAAVKKHSGKSWFKRGQSYPMVNKLVDPENYQFLVETNLPTPMTTRVYVNLLEANEVSIKKEEWQPN